MLIDNSLCVLLALTAGVCYGKGDSRGKSPVAADSTTVHTGNEENLMNYTPWPGNTVGPAMADDSFTYVPWSEDNSQKLHSSYIPWSATSVHNGDNNPVSKPITDYVPWTSNTDPNLKVTSLKKSDVNQTADAVVDPANNTKALDSTDYYIDANIPLTDAEKAKQAALGIGLVLGMEVLTRLPWRSGVTLASTVAARVGAAAKNLFLFDTSKAVAVAAGEAAATSIGGKATSTAAEAAVGAGTTAGAVGATAGAEGAAIATTVGVDAASIAGRGALSMLKSPGVFLIAVQLVLVILDAVGPYAEVKSKEVYKKLRQALDEEFESVVKSANVTAPVIYGPLDNIPKERLFSELRLEISRFRGPNAKPALQNVRKSVLLALIAYAVKNLCPKYGGLYIPEQNACSYRNKIECDKSYEWPLLNTSHYGEWMYQGRYCQATSPAMRVTCDHDSLTYISGIGQSCDLAEDYCLSKGMRYDGHGDCWISKTQNVMEMIFGKSLVRGLDQLFDPDQYSKCEKGESDDGYFCRRFSCPDGMEMNKIKTLCYDICPTGWHSDSGLLGSACSQDCPSPLSDSGFASCSKPLVIERGAGTPMHCPQDWVVSSPGFCQRQCTTPYSVSQSGVCYSDGVRKDAAGSVQLVIGPDKAPCDNGWRDDGTSCWDDLHSGIGRNGLVYTRGCGCIKKNLFDRQVCGDAYELKAGMCYAKSKPIQEVKSVGEIGTCSDGDERQGLLCFTNCNSGWSKFGLNLCTYNCPGDMSDGGIASCVKKPIRVSKSAVPGIKFTAKHRVVKFASEK